MAVDINESFDINSHFVRHKGKNYSETEWEAFNRAFIGTMGNASVAVEVTANGSVQTKQDQLNEKYGNVDSIQSLLSGVQKTIKDIKPITNKTINLEDEKWYEQFRQEETFHLFLDWNDVHSIDPLTRLQNKIFTLWS